MNYKIKKIYCLLCDDFKHLEEVDWKEYIDHGKSHHNVTIKDISKINIFLNNIKKLNDET